MSECPEETKISSVSSGKQRIVRELQGAPTASVRQKTRKERITKGKVLKE
jgi:hypothetical protein